ncbi:DMT family transporter [Lentilactobacillus sunkii]|jgi:small multidrug resistance pump|uniref:Multidrug transporter EmrE n=2 Tax=Lentilactobacillus sunkii TaxID=481719 RepID=A0A0R1L1I0_9LACO|nr:multidrug efflux SMR transporter [Lentilactobacillus sunkii]KRK89589.1 multidrug transporter EmrE [Lentilactobacillus sunkii DSM 19904]OFA10546.1 quaternary ammonium compound-resistance protein QacC [Lentilactobacillus sunkii]
MGYVFLIIAIVGELLGTNLLKASTGFTIFWPSVGALGAYGLCFVFLAIAMESLSLNLAYALWSGIGIVMTTVISIVLWKEPINAASIIGIGLILVGVVVLNLYGPSH